MTTMAAPAAILGALAFLAAWRAARSLETPIKAR
jgi:hypothetical protein